MREEHYTTVAQDIQERLKSFLKQEGKTLIIGVGSEYKTDDGAGIEAIRQLKSAGIDEQAMLLEVGRGLVNHLPTIADIKPLRILFIDAANLGLEPGEIKLLQDYQITEANISTHENNFNLAFAFLKKTLPECQVLFLGIQFDSLDMCEELTLTEEIKKSVERVVALIINALR